MANKILIGSDIGSPIFEFTNASIESCSAVLSSAMSGEELAIDQFMPVVYDAAYISVNFIPKDSTGLRTADGKIFNVKRGTQYLDKLPYGTPIWYYNNDNLIGKFYSQRIARTGKAKFDVLAVSAVGILDGQQHNGGIYTGQTFASVAGDIIGDQFTFTCAGDVANISIVGWLPIGTRRSNLHQLLFACGVALYKDADGEIVFHFPDTGTVKNIPDNRIFLGGNVDYQTPATKAEVTEHTFLTSPVDEEVTLYDNTDSETANHVFVTFQNAPVYDLAVTDTLTIEDSGVNYAIVSGTGTLTGKKYSHITRVLSSNTGDDTAVEKAVSVTEATLVNVANSENVLKRVLSYYSSARIIRNDIVLEGELAGDQVSFNNPYNEAEQAFIASLDITASSFLRASCEMITGYYPSGGGNNYTKSVVLTGSGEWVSPITGKIRVAIIGGGTGGSGGLCGECGDGYEIHYSFSDGTGDVSHIDKNGSQSLIGSLSRDASNDFGYSGGKNPGIGGSPGTPGHGGKVFIVSLNVTKGQRIPYSCGVGGIGGKGQKYTDGIPYNIKSHSFSDPTEGTDGTDSTFGSWSSADGKVQDYGFLDVITNQLLAQIGESGTSGNSGFLGGATVTDKGGGVGGNPGSGVDANAYYYDTRPAFKDVACEYSCAGGGDGGGAFGASSPRGLNGTDYYVYDGTMLHGMGARGATPRKPDKPSAIGRGGQAGHGGGGGGTAGYFKRKLQSIYQGIANALAGGLGGDGSDGGDGADGGIVIFM